MSIAMVLDGASQHGGSNVATAPVEPNSPLVSGASGKAGKVPSASAKSSKSKWSGWASKSSKSSTVDDILARLLALEAEVDALRHCVDYNSANGGTCHIGGDVDNVLVDANSRAYIGTVAEAADGGAGLLIEMSKVQDEQVVEILLATAGGGLAIKNDDVDIISESSVKMSSAEDITVYAMKNVDISGSDGSAGLKITEAKADLFGGSIIIEATNNIDIASEEDSITIEASASITMSADLNGQPDGSNSISIQTGDVSGGGGIKAGLDISNKVDLFSSVDSINIKAHKTIDIQALGDAGGILIRQGDDTNPAGSLLITDDVDIISAFGGIRMNTANGPGAINFQPKCGGSNFDFNACDIAPAP